MPGLDPGIHGVPKVPMSDFRANGDAWMAGSSPAMTVLDYLVLASKLMARNDRCAPDGMAIKSTHDYEIRRL